jgi:superfamily II DNA or RNA helicase
MTRISDKAYDAMKRRIPGTLVDGSEARLHSMESARPHVVHRMSTSVHKSSSGSAPQSCSTKTNSTKKRVSKDNTDSINTVKPRTILEVPFDARYEARNAGAKYDPKLKINYYEGDDLPARLRAWRSEDYSYTRWIEDQMNGRIRPVPLGPTMFTPRPHQAEAASAISKAYKNNRPGFLIADSTGLGKTLSIVAGICEIAKMKKASPEKRLKVLVSCPKGAMPVWRQTLRAYADSVMLRPMILNYQQLQKLLKEPTSMKKELKNARRAKTRAGTRNAKHRASRNLARDGVPKINFDVIVFDESHYLKNYGSSNVSLVAANLAMLHDPYQRGGRPFVVYSTATPGSTPLNLAIMAPLLGGIIDPKSKHVDPKDWGQFLHAHKFHVDRSDSKHPWSWISVPWYGAKSDDPKERAKYQKAKQKTIDLQNEDTERIGRAWAQSDAYLARDPSDLKGWPIQQVEPYYIELDAEGRDAYDEAWTRFREYLKLKDRGQADPKSALIENLRFRQKASLLKAPMIASHAEDLVDDGKQVFIGCQFLETVDEIERALTSARVKWTEVSGRVEDKVANRLKFQRGEAKVVLCTVTEAVSFHAEEILPDGTRATSADRVTIMADVRQNPNDCVQQMGRCHREGKHSLCEFPVILDTVDVKVMDSFISKARNLKKMKAEDDPDYLDRVFEEIV